MEETIAAISTALGTGAISIIRVSGKDAIPIVNKLFPSKDLTKVESHTIHYGHIIDHGEVIDEVLISIMKAPKTFTKEDIVEINSHGGIAPTQKMLEVLLKNGCRQAEPGEFTKRAFLNGRIDLLEAEGVMDLINSKTDKARALALSQVDGNLSNLIKKQRQEIIELLANIEVNIDYPEYEDIEQLTIQDLKQKMTKIEKELKRILKTGENGKIIKEGINTSIIGRPNVGKSSILNSLLNEEKAIVTNIEGTTRDVVEGSITIDGILFNMLDTAGIRQTDNVVEKIGVQKSLDLIKKSDLILFILNNNDPMKEEDWKILETLKDKKYLIIINKMDLESKIDFEKIKDYQYIKVSALEKIGIDEIKNKIRELFHLEELENKDFTYLTNARTVALIHQALSSLEEVKDGIEKNMPIDMIEIDLKNIWNTLGEITGDTYHEELINQLFSQFCLGK